MEYFGLSIRLIIEERIWELAHKCARRPSKPKGRRRRSTEWLQFQAKRRN